MARKDNATISPWGVALRKQRRPLTPQEMLEILGIAREIIVERHKHEDKWLKNYSPKTCAEDLSRMLPGFVFSAVLRCAVWEYLDYRLFCSNGWNLSYSMRASERTKELAEVCVEAFLKLYGSYEAADAKGVHMAPNYHCFAVLVPQSEWPELLDSLVQYLEPVSA